MRRSLIIRFSGWLLGIAMLAGSGASWADKSSLLTVDTYFFTNTSVFNNYIARDLARRAGDEQIRLNFFVGHDEQDDLRRQLAAHRGKRKNPMIVNAKNNRAARVAVEYARKAGVPIVFVSRDPGDDVLQMYDNAWYVGTDRNLAGTFQAEQILIYTRQHHNFDRNHNGVLDFILIKGEIDHYDTHARTKTMNDTLDSARFSFDIIAEFHANWNQERAYQGLKRLIERKRVSMDDVEAIICQSDSMALGALRWLKEQGFNDRDPDKWIPVLGIDGIPPAIIAVAQGRMQSTVLRDPAIFATTALKLIRELALHGADHVTQERVGLKVSRDRRLVVPSVFINHPAAIKMVGFKPEAPDEVRTAD